MLATSANDFGAARARMVRDQIAARGVRDRRVLAAMGTVPREHFLPADRAEFAYQDSPLAIDLGQTMSQPYIVALMAAILELQGNERVLEVGTGSGYGAAVLSQLAREVFTIERHPELAFLSAQRIDTAGYRNVSVVQGDGTLGLPEHAPFDAIVVTASGPQVPQALLDQLAVGGRLVIPVGAGRELQRLVRIRRLSPDDYHREELESVRFVPLIGEQGWREENRPARTAAARPARGLPLLLRESGEPIERIEDHSCDALLERIGEARVVLIGEATHGTSEFYRMRAQITRRLIERKGFRIVALEADWPDAAVVDRYVRALVNGHPPPGEAFRRFPAWMWRNDETRSFVEWLRARNAESGIDDRVGFHGLDIYSLFTSIRAVVRYLDRVDPEAAAVARHRYACLTPWEQAPASYARAAVSGGYRLCEKEAVAILEAMLARRSEYAARDGYRFIDAVGNARLVAGAERYYRSMYYGRAESWNLRDQHMFETLVLLLKEAGPGGRAVVWAHNSHVGDAAATELAAQGETNLGQLCRQTHDARCYAIGFGTDHGQVAAASEWDGDMQRMAVRPAHALSYERVFHDSGRPAYLLPLRHPARIEVSQELALPRLERAIGVVYRPDSELQSHYFQAVLPRQFDEYIWFDETRAVRALSSSRAQALPAIHPFAWR
jgi:protein-L-isoaspartate(D-aspartate) O-methyltransferase